MKDIFSASDLAGLSLEQAESVARYLSFAFRVVRQSHSSGGGFGYIEGSMLDDFARETGIMLSDNYSLSNDYERTIALVACGGKSAPGSGSEAFVGAKDSLAAMAALILRSVYIPGDHAFRGASGEQLDEIANACGVLDETRIAGLATGIADAASELSAKVMRD